MKKLIILSAITAGSLFYNTANAQFRIRLGFRFAPRAVVYAPAPVVVEQPQACEQTAAVDDGQSQAYNNDDDYYYLPDVGAYYSVNENCYYYNDGDNWVSAAYLPGTYRDYNWRYAPRYEVRASRPYMHDDFYRSRYNGRQVAEWRHDYTHNDNGYAHRGYDQHYNNSRPQVGYNQNFDNKGHRGFGQPNHNEGGNNQHFDNRGQGGFGRPSNQNFGHERVGTEHFAQNNRPGADNHRMGRF